MDQILYDQPGPIYKWSTKNVMEDKNIEIGPRVLLIWELGREEEEEEELS